MKKSKKPRQGKSYYPWKTWMTRRVNLHLVRGTDFVCAPYIMAQQIRNAANRYEVHVSISIQGNEIDIKITRKE